MIAENQPVTLAAMEGLFETTAGAPIALIGQPDTDKLALDNPIVVPKMLSFLTYRRWEAEVRGLKDFPRDQWPDNIPLLYYSYHIMVGFGTMLILLMLICAWALVARAALQQPRTAVGVDAGPSVSLYRHHGRLDDRRAGTAALVDLWLDAHRRRCFLACFGRKWIVHADGFHGALPASWNPVPVSGASRDRSRARAAAGGVE